MGEGRDVSGRQCSFCGKDGSEVSKLVSARQVSICDECVALSVEILAAEVAQPGSGDRPGTQSAVDTNLAEVLPRLRALETLVGLQLGGIGLSDPADRPAFESFARSIPGGDDAGLGIADDLTALCDYLERRGGHVLDALETPCGHRLAAVRTADGATVILSQRKRHWEF